MPMKYDVVVETAQAGLVAAVRVTVPLSDITRAWKPALDQVWAFLKTKGGELDPGHNLFLYHHPERRNEAMNIDFGVQVARPFEREGDVRCIETPTMQSTLGALRTTGKSRRLRGKSTVTGMTIPLCSRRLSSICWPESSPSGERCEFLESALKVTRAP